MQALIRDDGLARKLEAMAEDMQAAIDAQFRTRQENTPKRARQAAEARNEGRHLKRTQAAIRALARANAAGTCPRSLATLKSKSAVYDLMKTKIEYKGGYYDAGRDTGEPYLDTEQARALWQLVGGTTDADRQAQKLEQALAVIKFSNIAGYFPTPAPLVARMIERADLQPGQYVLEPSAGSGNIADAIRAAEPKAKLHCCEINHTLTIILALKGHDVSNKNFTDWPTSELYHSILMNPPFEHGQDIDHIQHAFKMLAHGGRLVAIMSHGPFYRSDKKAEAFRQWFIEVGGEPEPIPAGAFKESGTDIPTVLIEIRKD